MSIKIIFLILTSFYMCEIPSTWIDNGAGYSCTEAAVITTFGEDFNIDEYNYVDFIIETYGNESAPR